jgi:[ribosomal protein S5]-alanine N-acetyltransferase
MEKMPYRPDLEPESGLRPDGQTADGWRHRLPVLAGPRVTLRGLELSDGPALHSALARQEVSRFISKPPADVAGFERFITWVQARRADGLQFCFAVVPNGRDAAVGLFQVRQIEPGFGSAEWGFAIASEYWGTGIFHEAARLVTDFTFDVVGAHRLEARAATLNGRGNAALRKFGAVEEGTLRRSLLRNGEYLDETLWSILDEDWRRARDPQNQLQR